MSKKNTAPRLGSAVGGIGSLLASLTCILVGLVIGFVVLLVLGWITLAQDGNSLTFGQMQPFDRGTRLSSFCVTAPPFWISSASIFISPMSLTMTATL